MKYLSVFLYAFSLALGVTAVTTSVGFCQNSAPDIGTGIIYYSQQSGFSTQLTGALSVNVNDNNDYGHGKVTCNPNILSINPDDFIIPCGSSGTTNLNGSIGLATGTSFAAGTTTNVTLTGSVDYYYNSGTGICDPTNRVTTPPCAYDHFNSGNTAWNVGSIPYPECHTSFKDNVTNTANIQVISINVVITGLTFVCNGASTTYCAITTPATGGSVLWSTGETTNCITITPTTTTLLSCTFTIEGISYTTTINVIAGASPIVGPIVNPISCHNGNNGSISLSPSGGTPPYSYFWGTTAGTSTYTNLGPGNYDGSVVDNNGCTVVFNAMIDNPSEITATASIINVSCNGHHDGKITVHASGGTAPYKYSWGPPLNIIDGDSSYQNLAAGTYNILVTDVHGCQASVVAIISQPDILTIGTSINPISCHDKLDGSITLNPTGGTPPYTYYWGTTLGTATKNNIGAGTYDGYVVDANGCFKTFSVNLNNPDQLVATTTITKVSCNGRHDGQVVVNAVGGTTPYSYSWGPPINVTSTTSTFHNLYAGTYDINVSDVHGCQTNVSAPVTQPDPLNVSTNILEHTVFATVTGGTPFTAGAPYFQYYWSMAPAGYTVVNWFSFYTAPTNASYSVNVIDANGCNMLVNFNY